jgi:hypothetical protein
MMSLSLSLSLSSGGSSGTYKRGRSLKHCQKNECLVRTFIGHVNLWPCKDPKEASFARSTQQEA